MNISLDDPLLVVAHDAGGAEVVAAWLARFFPRPYSAVVEGPAQRVFRDRMPGSPTFMAREAALSTLAGFRTVLTATGWGSDLEKVFRREGARSGLRTIAYLDHWTDYRERFLEGGKPCLPSEIWVGDEHAERLVRELFPDQPLRNVGNHHLAAQVDALRRQPRTPASRGKRVLFISEPLGAAAQQKFGDRNRYGYTEEQALEGFLRYAAAHWAQDMAGLRVRRHPFELAGKFAARLAAHPALAGVECGEAPLIEDCAWADRIVGCQSMALVVGLLAGKEVFCAIPRGAPGPQIPYPGIVRLFGADDDRP